MMQFRDVSDSQMILMNVWNYYLEMSWEPKSKVSYNIEDKVQGLNSSLSVTNYFLLVPSWNFSNSLSPSKMFLICRLIFKTPDTFLSNLLNKLSSTMTQFYVKLFKQMLSAIPNVFYFEIFITINRVSVFYVFIGIIQRFETPLTNYFDYAHFQIYVILIRGKELSFTFISSSGYISYELRMRSLSNVCSGISLTIEGRNIISCEPATLLTKSRTNRYETQELLCKTARIRMKRGVARSTDFEIDFEGM